MILKRLNVTLELFSNVAERCLRGFRPGFASGLITHQELFPAPSFCIRIKRLCSDKLCRIEFYNMSHQADTVMQRCVIEL